LRDYGTAKWEGGDAACDHKVGRFERGGLSSKQASNAGSGGDEAKHICPKCGARRVDSQIGLEQTPEDYVAEMVAVFREVRRVLRDDGMLWLNLGSSYAGGGRGCDTPKQKSNRGTNGMPESIVPPGYKPKDMVPIPWLVAMALQADGWYLRQDIIWHKPNPMPESVTDRCTKSHEYLFLLSKSERYFYDAEAIAEPTADANAQRTTAHYNTAERYGAGNGGNSGLDSLASRMRTGEHTMRNKRDVWTVATHPYKGAHFATFPPALIEPCILAGTSERGCCPKCGKPWVRVVEKTDELDTSARGSRFDAGKTGARDGGDRTQAGERYTNRTTGWRPGCECGGEPVPCTVLDPFGGSGTTGEVANGNGRDAVLIELNPAYVELQRQRCGLFC